MVSMQSPGVRSDPMVSQSCHNKQTSTEIGRENPLTFELQRNPASAGLTQSTTDNRASAPELSGASVPSGAPAGPCA